MQVRWIRMFDIKTCVYYLISRVVTIHKNLWMSKNWVTWDTIQKVESFMMCRYTAKGGYLFFFKWKDTHS